MCTDCTGCALIAASKRKKKPRNKSAYGPAVITYSSQSHPHSAFYTAPYVPEHLCVCVCVCDGGGVSTTVGSVSCKQTTRELLLYGKIKTSKHNRDKVTLLCYSLRPSITSLLCISIFYDSGCLFFHPLESKLHRYQQVANDSSVFGSCTFLFIQFKPRNKLY